jgi:hypothetical protein
MAALIAAATGLEAAWIVARRPCIAGRQAACGAWQACRRFDYDTWEVKVREALIKFEF